MVDGYRVRTLERSAIKGGGAVEQGGLRARPQPLKSRDGAEAEKQPREK